ncbi:MAG: radical SAM protein [Chloroflexi bacterium]|nr:radical SAM protein [Chloroflexota bacterium]
MATGSCRSRSWCRAPATRRLRWARRGRVTSRFAGRRDCGRGDAAHGTASEALAGSTVHPIEGERSRVTSIESIYWVFTHNCNLRCAHCYNDSRPGAPTITQAEADAVLGHLPEVANRFILSGGEPLVELELPLHLVRSGRARYPHARVALQTNGDVLDRSTLDALTVAGVDSFSISSYDQFHPRPAGKFEGLRSLFASAGVVERQVGDPAENRPGGDAESEVSFTVWGANPELWVGGIWPRGRAMKYGLAQLMPEHNFCDRWSGALGFLDDGSAQQEVSIQLTSVYPCCPGTVEPLGDLAEESLTSILARHRGDPMWAALNRGDPAAMGAHAGFDRGAALERIAALGSVCLWCDEYMTERVRARGDRAEELPVQGERRLVPIATIEGGAH